MGEELEFDQFYIEVGDGKYVPFNGITEIKLTDDPDLNDVDGDAVYTQFPIFNEPMSFSINLESRANRKMAKFFKKMRNQLNRRIRYYKRQKERARRRALKGARYT